MEQSKGWYTYEVHVEGGGGSKAKMRFYRTFYRTKEGGVSESSGCPVFFIEENWICAMTRYHAEPNINILLTKNLLFDTDARQWRHPLMIPLHFLVAKSSIWMWNHLVLFLLLNRLFTIMVRLLFHSFTFSICADKQVDCKLGTKKWITINERHFVTFLDNGTHKSIKPRKSRKWGFS